MTKEEASRIYHMGFDAAWGLACDAILEIIDSAHPNNSHRFGEYPEQVARFEQGEKSALDNVRAAVKDMKEGRR